MDRVSNRLRFASWKKCPLDLVCTLFLVLSIHWIFRHRLLDLLCMPMHRIGSFHLSLTCYSLYCSCILYPSSALIFSPLGIVGLEIRGRLIKSKLFSSLISLAEAISARSPFRLLPFRWLCESWSTGFRHSAGVSLTLQNHVLALTLQYSRKNTRSSCKP